MPSIKDDRKDRSIKNQWAFYKLRYELGFRFRLRQK